VVGAPEEIGGEPAAVSEFERVVLPLRLRRPLAERRLAGRELDLGRTLTGVADQVTLVARRIKEADVLDGPNQLVVDDVDRRGAERSAYQLVLRPIEVPSVAAEDLGATVTEDVEGCAQARRKLVGPSEHERVLLVIGTERRDVLMFGPQAQVQSQAVANRPLI